MQLIQRLLAIACIFVVAACGKMDKESAALQVREHFCSDWPYGCTDSTRVEIGKVQETPNGLSVEFEVIDRADRSGKLAAAYFEPADDGWGLLLFEDPFLTRLKEQIGALNQDRKEVTDLLMTLRSAENWHKTIYSVYSSSYEELKRVNYKPPEGRTLRLSVEEGGAQWKAELNGRYVLCHIRSEMLLPKCPVRTPGTAGSASGPLSTEFGG